MLIFSPSRYILVLEFWGKCPSAIQGVALLIRELQAQEAGMVVTRLISGLTESEGSALCMNSEVMRAQGDLTFSYSFPIPPPSSETGPVTPSTPTAHRMSEGWNGKPEEGPGRQARWLFSQPELSFQSGLIAISSLGLPGGPAVQRSQLLSSTLNWLLSKGLKKDSKSHAFQTTTPYRRNPS